MRWHPLNQNPQDLVISAGNPNQLLRQDSRCDHVNQVIGYNNTQFACAYAFFRRLDAEAHSPNTSLEECGATTESLLHVLPYLHVGGTETSPRDEGKSDVSKQEVSKMPTHM